jgi:hypothetical protein
MAKKDVVQVPITCCNQCRHCKQEKYYTADSYEDVTAWNCTHPDLGGAKNPTSSARGSWVSPPGIGRLDWNDPKPAIPSWCPFRKKSRSKKS